VWTTLDCSHRKTGFKRAIRGSLPIRPQNRIGDGCSDPTGTQNCAFKRPMSASTDLLTER
jgi:hypothetical protein